MSRALISTRFNHTVLVGIAASVLDWLALVFLVNFVHLSPQAANVPSLILGSCAQFVGNRYFVFKSTQRNAGKQAGEFAIVEAMAFVLNASLFYELVNLKLVYYMLARPLSSFAVFALFSYPMWKLVFRKAKT